jgi:hypothetical protein
LGEKKSWRIIEGAVRAERIQAAFEQGRRDAQLRNGAQARYADPERDAAYLRGYHFEAQHRPDLYQKKVKAKR